MTPELDALIALEVPAELLTLKTKAVADARAAIATDTPEARTQAAESLKRLHAALSADKQ